MDTGLVSRRDMLRRGFAVGALLAGAGAVSGVAGALVLDGATAGRMVLSAAEVAIVAAVARTMFPAGAMPLDGVEAGVVGEVDRLMAEYLAPVHAAGFRYLLRTLEWGTFAARGTRFSQLGDADRTEVLHAWASPGILPRRVASDALKMVMGMAYFRNPAVLSHVGYRAACGGVTA